VRRELGDQQCEGRVGSRIDRQAGDLTGNSAAARIDSATELEGGRLKGMKFSVGSEDLAAAAAGAGSRIR
jgi:hypothetical protein